MEYRTIRQAADDLGVKVRTIRAWISDGKLKAIKCGNHWLIGIDEIKRFSEEKYSQFGAKISIDGRPLAHVKSNTALNVDIMRRDGTRMQNALKIKCGQSEYGPAIVILDEYNNVIFKSV